MKDFNHIQDQVGKALNSLEGVHAASPAPFFFTRVGARLNNRDSNIWEKISGFIARPSIAVAGLCLVILLNAIAVLNEKQPGTPLAEQSEQVYADEYNMAVNTFYDIENTEP